MGKKILTFGDIEIEKNKFYKSPFPLRNWEGLTKISRKY